MTKTTAPQSVKAYRKDWRGSAATALSFIVSLVVVLGGYQVITALNVRAPSRSSSILPVTRDVVRDSVGAVLDDRLSDERLKAMLGVDAAAAKEREKQSELAKVAKQAGQAVDAPPPGPDYAVKHFRTRSSDLADELTSRIDASAVSTLAPCADTKDQRQNTPAACYVAGNRESELRSIRDAVQASVQRSLAAAGSDPAQSPDPVKRWVDGVVADAGVERIWRDARYTDKPADFLVRALDPSTLPAAVAKRGQSTAGLSDMKASRFRTM